MKEKKLECLYCQKVGIVSKSFKSYVCDECYHKNQVKKKSIFIKVSDRCCAQRYDYRCRQDVVDL